MGQQSLQLMIYLIFFISGISGLVYQVIWIRQFGLVFGNTIYSSSIVIGVFMLGLGLGSYIIGSFSDNKYRQNPTTALKLYAVSEVLIAALGLGIALLLVTWKAYRVRSLPIAPGRPSCGTVHACR